MVFTAVFVSIILIVIIKYNMLLFASGAPKALRLYVVSASEKREVLTGDPKIVESSKKKRIEIKNKA